MIKIFLNPTKAIMVIVLTIVVILICLGIVIIYLHRKEKVNIKIIHFRLKIDKIRMNISGYLVEC
jgi:hypothetical protein